MFVKYIKHQRENKKNIWLPGRHVFLNVASKENEPEWSSVAKDKGVLELVESERLRKARYYLSNNLQIEEERLRTRLAIDDATAEKMKKKQPNELLSKIILDQEVNAELSRVIKLEHKKKPFWKRIAHNLTGQNPSPDKSRIEAEKYTELFGSEIYHPGRLSKFLAEIKDKDEAFYNKLTKEYAIDMDRLKDDINAQIFVSELLFIYDSEGNGTDITPVKKAIDGIGELSEAAVKTPATTEEMERAENLKKIDDLYSKIPEHKEKLMDAYVKAANHNERLKELEKAVSDQQDNIDKNASSLSKEGRQAALARLNQADAALNAAQDQRGTILNEINGLERGYKNLAGKLIETLLYTSDPKNPPTSPPQGQTSLIEFNKRSNLPVSEKKNFFGPSPVNKSDLQKHIEGDLTATFFRELTKEIDDKYKKTLKPHEPVDPYHGFILLKKYQFDTNKVGDPSDRMEAARLLAGMTKARIETDHIPLAGKQIGIWGKAKRYLASEFISSKTFKAQDVITALTAKEKYKKFAGLKQKFSLKETGRYLEENKATLVETAEFCAHLKRAVKEYRIVGDLKKIIDNLETLLAAMKTRQMNDAVKKATEKNPGKSKAEIFKEATAEMKESEEALSKSLREITKGKDWDIRKALSGKKTGKQPKAEVKQEEKEKKEGEKPKNGEKPAEVEKLKEKSKWTIGNALKWTTLPMWVTPYLTYKLGKGIAKWAWPRRGKILKYSTAPVWVLPWAALKVIKGTVGIAHYSEKKRAADEAKYGPIIAARKAGKEKKPKKSEGGGHH